MVDRPKLKGPARAERANRDSFVRMVETLTGDASPLGTVTGTESGGEARLIQPLRKGIGEALLVRWNANENIHVEIEPRVDISSLDPEQTVPADVAANAMVPHLWSLIRDGAPLPEGADRFAHWFSVLS